MKLFKEFGAFIKRGNVLDLAIGMIIGTAFNKIVSSLVNDVVMPCIGAICKVNVTELKVILVPEVIDPVTEEIVTKAVTLNYGNFIQTIIDFLIIAFSVFMAMKVIVAANKSIRSASEKLVDAIKRNDDKEETEEVEQIEE